MVASAASHTSSMRTKARSAGKIVERGLGSLTPSLLPWLALR
jgi:hypothetical protein